VNKTEKRTLLILIIFGIILGITLMVLGVSCEKTPTKSTVTATPTIDRTVVGTLQTIDSYQDYSVLHFDNNISIEVTNSSLNHWWIAHAFNQVCTYQLQGVGMSFDDGYHEFNLVGFQINQVILGGNK